MNTIDDKIKMFQDIVNEKIQEEKNRVFESFEKEKEEILAEENRKLSLKEKQVMEEAFKRANVKAKELLAKAKLEKQRAELSFKKELLEDIVRELGKRLHAYTLSPEYKNYLLSSVKTAVSDLEEGSYVVYLETEDVNRYSKEVEELLSHFPGRNFEIKNSSKDLLGGVIVEDKSGRFRIDSSLYSKLQQIKPYIGAELMERLA